MIMAKIFNREKFFRHFFRPGTVMITDGIMGGGKTHQAVAMCEEYMESNPKMNIFLITNIVYATMTKAGLKKGYPANVYGVETMKQVFETIRDLLKIHKYNEMTILLVLDEAQNFIPLMYNDPVTSAMHKFLANCRKFGVCVWLLTPVINNLGPRIRGTKWDDKPGYCTLIWRKNPKVINDYMQTKGIRSDPQKFTTVVWKADMEPFVMYVPHPAWTTPLNDLKLGEYAYDTGSAADFCIGDDFDFGKCIQGCSGLLSDEICEALDRFFNKEDGVGDEEDYLLIRNREQAMRVDRGRALLDLTWDEIGTYEGENKETVRARYKVYFENNPSQKIDTASKSVNCEGQSNSRARRDRERESITYQQSKGDLAKLPITAEADNDASIEQEG